MKNRRRAESIYMMVSKEEREQIDQRMAEAGQTNLRAYLLHMALHGYVLKVELDSIKDMVKLLSKVSTKVEEQVGVPNAEDGILKPEFQMLKRQVEEIWMQTKIILQEIAKL